MARRGWSKGSSVMGASASIDGGADPLVRGRRPRRPTPVDEADFAGEERVQGDPRGPGGPPHHISRRHRFGHYPHWPLAMVHFSPATKFTFGEGYPKTSSYRRLSALRRLP